MWCVFYDPNGKFANQRCGTRIRHIHRIEIGTGYDLGRETLERKC